MSTTEPRAAIGAIPRSVWALGFVSLLMDVSSEMVHSLLPVFLVGALGASALTVGLIEGAAEATALIVKVFSGALSDHFGKRKPLAVAGYALAALSKPLFALASSAGLVLFARLLDRVGKGIRGAPRDALVADLAHPSIRGAAFGLRQALDTVGAALGPLLAIVLMLLWANDFRVVFWVAVVPAVLSVALLVVGVREPERAAKAARTNPIRRANLKRLSAAYWWVVAIGAVFTLARFSEAFLILRASQGGLAVAWTPIVLVGMNLCYALSAYPFGHLSDRMSPPGRPKGEFRSAQREGIPTNHGKLLALGLLVLIAADLALAHSNTGGWLALGIALWGLHMGMTQGLFARMIADTAPEDLRGTAYGLFFLVSGIATLIANIVAGWLWDALGAPLMFLAGALFSLLTLGVLLLRHRHLSVALG